MLGTWVTATVAFVTTSQLPNRDAHLNTSCGRYPPPLLQAPWCPTCEVLSEECMNLSAHLVGVGAERRCAASNIFLLDGWPCFKLPPGFRPLIEVCGCVRVCVCVSGCAGH